MKFPIFLGIDELKSEVESLELEVESEKKVASLEEAIKSHRMRLELERCKSELFHKGELIDQYEKRLKEIGVTNTLG